MITEKTFQGAWNVSALVNGQLITRQYFMPKRDAISVFKQETRTVFFNWNGPQGLETVDELSRVDFDGDGSFRAEIKRLKAEYALAGMDVYVSTRACADWRN